MIPTISHLIIDIKESMPMKKRYLSIYMGQKLKAIRKEKGFTQKALADQLNINESTVAKWEQGIVTIPSEELIRIKKILDIKSIDELLPPSEIEDDTFIKEFLDKVGLGSKVKVYEWQNKGKYKVSDNHLDAFNRPLTYNISGIVKNDTGDPSIYLESKARSGFIYKYYMDLKHIASGYYRLVK